MPTLEQEKTQRERLEGVLSELEKIRPEDLVRSDVLGQSLSFGAGLPYFRRTLGLFRRLHEANLETVPFNRLQSLANVGEQALQQFKSIQAFTIEQNAQNPGSVRDNLINQVRDTYDTYFDVISPVLAYSVRRGVDFDRLQQEAQEAVRQVTSILADQKRASDTMLAELESTLEKVRRAAQEAGVSQHAIYFHEEADEHRSQANHWLATTSVLATFTVAMIIALLISFYRTLPDLTSAQSIQLAALKLILFSVLFSGLVAGGRIYRAHRHNYVINKHRQNALSTFEAFVKAAKDDATKNAVLLQATQCIFSPQSTGYVHDNESGGTPGMWETLGAIAGSQSRK